MSLVNDMLVDLHNRDVTTDYVPSRNVVSPYMAIVILAITVIGVFFIILLTKNNQFTPDNTVNPVVIGEKILLSESVSHSDNASALKEAIDKNTELELNITSYLRNKNDVGKSEKIVLDRQQQNDSLAKETVEMFSDTSISDRNDVSPLRPIKEEKEVVAVENIDLPRTSAITNKSVLVDSQHEKNMHIEVSAGSDDVFVFEQAKKLFVNRGAAPAMTYLRSAVSAAHAMPKSRLLLADFLFDEQGETAAMAFAKQQDNSAVDWVRYVQARIFIKNASYLPALDLLEAHQQSPALSIRQDELQAAVYQKLGQYQQAGLIYKKLIDHDSRASRYWLGFAISQDTLANDVLALDAYTNAARLNDLSAPIQQFVRERIVVLAQGVR